MLMQEIVKECWRYRLQRIHENARAASRLAMLEHQRGAVHLAQRYAEEILYGLDQIASIDEPPFYMIWYSAMSHTVLQAIGDVRAAAVLKRRIISPPTRY